MEVDQRNQWKKYFPLLEYAYNNTIHSSIGKAPFKVIEGGRHKLPLIVKYLGNFFAIDEYIRDLKESVDKIKESISIVQQKKKVTIDKHSKNWSS